MQELEAQKQDAQDRLDEMDQQKAKLRDMLSDVRQKCQDETQTVRPQAASSAPHLGEDMWQSPPCGCWLLNPCDASFQISSLKTQIQSQESDLKSQEDDLNRARSELSRLQQEETQLEQSIQAGRVQLETIIKSLKSTQDEISQVPRRLALPAPTIPSAPPAPAQRSQVVDVGLLLVGLGHSCLPVLVRAGGMRCKRWLLPQCIE